MINKTVMCIDGGLFGSWALRLAKEYKRVLHFRPWTRSFSHPNDYIISSGYPQVERIEHFWDHIEECDTFCFLDIHFPDWADYLRDQGKAVWSAFHGEELELYRAETKALLKKVGLPVGKYVVLNGMDELREHLEKHDDQIVKISKLRGLTETFESERYDLIKIKLDDIEHKLGGLADSQEFVVEEKIEAITESGFDGICIQGQFPKTSVVGYEIKDSGCASKVTPYNLLPKEVRETNDKLSGTLKNFGYQGFFSTEIRVTEDSYFPIDFTCRAASPAGESLQELFSNIGEVIEAGAHSEIVEPIAQHKYAAQAMIKSEFAAESWLPIYIPKKARDRFKLYHAARVDGQEFIVPTGIDMAEIGSVVGVGNSIDEAIKDCEKLAKQIEGYQIKVNTDALHEAKEELEKAA